MKYLRVVASILMLIGLFGISFGVLWAVHQVDRDLWLITMAGTFVLCFSILALLIEMNWK